MANLDIGALRRDFVPALPRAESLATAAAVAALAAIILPQLLHALPPIDTARGLTVAAVFAAALVSGLAGFAFSAIAGGAILHWSPANETVPLLLACSITTQLVSIIGLWRLMQWRRCATLLIGGLVGIPLGAALLQTLDARIFAVVFGGFLVCYSAWLLLKPSLVVRSDHPVVTALVGLAGGVLGGAIAFPGAIPTVWCNLRGLPKESQRGTVQPFILVMQLATLIYFSRAGMIAHGLTSEFLECAPAALAGTGVGLCLFHRINDQAFRRAVLVLLCLSGAMLAL